MLKVKHKANKPCVKCGSKEKTIRVEDGDDRMVLCLDHAYELVPNEPAAKTKKKKDPTNEKP